MYDFIDERRYIDYDKFEKLSKLVGQAVKVEEWQTMLAHLQLVDNKAQEQQDWFYRTKTKFISHDTDIVMEDRLNELRDCTNWFMITVFNRYRPALHTSLVPKFQQVLDYIATMKGIKEIVLEFVGPGTHISTHIDDETRAPYEGMPSVHFNSVVTVTGTGIVTLDGVSRNAGAVTTLDSQIPHSATNNTDDWWLFMVIHIDRECYD